MDRDLPEPQPFDPLRPSLSSFLPEAGEEGRTVALVVSSSNASGDWAERTASALASAWAEQGLRVLLADFGLADPRLHRALGTANDEGASDVFLFGSSLRRVARPVEGGRFLFMPAGTATARPEAVASSSRWDATMDGCVRARATLVLFFPMDQAGAPVLLQRATDVLLLHRGEGDPDEAWIEAVGDRLRGVLKPPATLSDAVAGPAAGTDALPATDSPPPTAETVAPPEPTPAAPPGPDVDGEGVPDIESSSDPLGGMELDLTLVEESDSPPAGTMAFTDASQDGLPDDDALPPPPPLAFDGEVDEGTDLPEREGAGRPEAVETSTEPPPPGASTSSPMADSPQTEDGAPPEGRSDPPAPVARAVPRGRPGRKPDRAPASRTRLLVLLLVLIVVAVLAAAWYGLVEIPLLTPLLGGAATAAPLAPASTSTTAVTAEPIPSVSLMLGAFTDAAVARLQARALEEQLPDLLFVIAPVDRDGTVYHRLLAGPAVDSLGASALRERLARLLTREDPAAWPLQPTPLAFLVGESVSLAEAGRRVEALSNLDIPAYVLELPAPGSGPPDADPSGARFRVYTGAYADAEEGAYMAGVLAERGVADAHLTARTGRQPR